MNRRRRPTTHVVQTAMRHLHLACYDVSDPTRLLARQLREQGLPWLAHADEEDEAS
jgi:hypothetical protein